MGGRPNRGRAWECAQAAIAERRRRAKEERERKEKEKDNVRTALGGRRERDRIILSAFEALFVKDVTLEELEHHTSVLHRDDYFDVVRERTLSCLCGYPLCGGPLQGDAGHGKGQFRISLSQRKIYSNKGRKFYCSDQCHTASSLFASSLPDYRRLVDPATYYRGTEGLGAEEESGEGEGEANAVAPPATAGTLAGIDGPIAEKELLPPSTEFDAAGFRSVEGFAGIRADAGGLAEGASGERERGAGGGDGVDGAAEGLKGMSVKEMGGGGDGGGRVREGEGQRGGEGGGDRVETKGKQKRGKKKGPNPWSAMVFGEGDAGSEEDEEEGEEEVGAVELPPSTRLLLLLQRCASPLSKFRLKLQPLALAFAPPTCPPRFTVDWRHTPEPKPSHPPAELEPLRGAQGVHAAGGGRARNALLGRRKILSAAIARRLKAARGLASEGHADWGEFLGSIGNAEAAMWTFIQSLDVDTEVPNLSPQQSDALLLLFVSLLRGTLEHVARGVVGEDGACRPALQRLWLNQTGLTADHFVSMQFPFLPDRVVDDWLVLDGQVTAGMAMWKECGGDLSTFAELEELD